MPLHESLQIMQTMDRIREQLDGPDRQRLRRSQ